MFEKRPIAVLVRLLAVVLFLSAAVSLGARGRARGYQAGGGTRHAQPKLRAKQPKDKQKKPSPPPDTRPDPLIMETR
jgi:hypothetical protein